MAHIPSRDSHSAHTQGQLRSLTVIVLALLGGMVSFAGLATYMALTKGPLMVPHPSNATSTNSLNPAASGGDPTTILYIVSGALTAFSILAYVIVGKLAQSQINKSVAGISPDERERTAIQPLMTTTIIRAGFAEGAGLFGAVVVLLTGTLYTLFAVVIAAVLLILLMPARARMASALAHAGRSPAPPPPF